MVWSVVRVISMVVRQKIFEQRWSILLCQARPVDNSVFLALPETKRFEFRALLDWEGVIQPRRFNWASAMRRLCQAKLESRLRLHGIEFIV